MKGVSQAFMCKQLVLGLEHSYQFLPDFCRSL